MLSSSIDCQLLCASASAYFVDPSGVFCSDAKKILIYPLFENIKFLRTPTPFTNTITSKVGKINAAILGETDFGHILAFRGTIPFKADVPEILKAEDWWNDVFKLNPVIAPGLPGKVHDGFQESFFSIWSGKDNIEEALKEIYVTGKSTKPLYITGHSKGGPLTSYAAYLAKQAGYPLGAVTTFASPYPGDAEFTEAYNKEISQTRYEYYLDIVPFVPPNSKVLGSLIPVFNTVLGILEGILPKSVGPFLEKFKVFIDQSANYNYQSVGSLKYIDQNFKIITPTTSEEQETLLKEREHDFVLLFEKNIFHPLEDLGKIGAHHTIFCGGGYATGVCGKC